MNPDVIDIIEGCKRKKNRYYSQLYERYSPALYAICLRYLKDENEALDCLQEGFLEIHNSIKNYRGDGSFEGWLKRLQVNVCLMYLRKKRKMKLESLNEETFVLAENDEEDDAPLSIKTMMSAIQHLPDGYRTVFNLFVIDGFTHQEIADKLSISEGTSKSQLARAKKILRKELLPKFNEQ